MTELKEQLQLTEHELWQIGFIKSDVECYEIPCLNGKFYINLNEPYFKWYQQIIIGDLSNHIQLDIPNLPTLYNILSAFKVPFNLSVFK